MGGSRGGTGGPDPPPPWNCKIINFCHVEIFRQTPSGNLDFWIRACWRLLKRKLKQNRKLENKIETKSLERIVICQEESG